MAFDLAGNFPAELLCLAAAAIMITRRMKATPAPKAKVFLFRVQTMPRLLIRFGHKHSFSLNQWIETNWSRWKCTWTLVSLTRKYVWIGKMKKYVCEPTCWLRRRFLPRGRCNWRGLWPEWQEILSWWQGVTRAVRSLRVVHFKKGEGYFLQSLTVKLNFLGMPSINPFSTNQIKVQNQRSCLYL